MIRRKQTLIEVLDERWKFPAQKRVKTQIEEVSGAGRYISSSNILGEAPSAKVCGSRLATSFKTVQHCPSIHCN